MKTTSSNARMVSKLLFRLLPVQILLALVNAANGTISGLYAGNYVGELAMSAVALFGPINMLIGALASLLVAGATILCGKLMGGNQLDRVQNLFSLDIMLSMLISAIFTVLMLFLGLFDLTGFLVKDEAVRPIFNRYLIGQAIGVFPLMLGTQLTSFLSLDNHARRATVASLVMLSANVLFNVLFVQVMHLEAFGLALASSLGLWTFLTIEAQYFLSEKSSLHFSIRNLPWSESTEIIKIGFPGAATSIYVTVRGLIVNGLIAAYIGSIGLSAMAASDAILRIFWTIPAGMLAVSRMLFSISIGEEDRQTLTNVMRNMFYRFLPLMCGVSALIILFAVPFTRMFYRDSSASVYMMTVWGFRILPLCMPLAVIVMHFSCYWQASNRPVIVNILAVLDGVVCVSGFTALLIRSIGMNSVYVANALNGIVATLIVLFYSWGKNRHFPKNIEELMIIPEDFGVAESDRLNLAVQNIDEVVIVSQTVQAFCQEKEIDTRRATIAGLAMEEMAGNVVYYGFPKDKRKHSVDIRVVYKDNGVILCIKDDCMPFNPVEQQNMFKPEDPAKNIGIRMIRKMSEDFYYRNILGLNVLTIRI